MIKTIKLPERKLLIKVCDMKSFKTCVKSFELKDKKYYDSDFLGRFIGVGTYDYKKCYWYYNIICIDIDSLKTKYNKLNTITHEVHHLVSAFTQQTNATNDEESNANLYGYLVEEISKIFKVI